MPMMILKDFLLRDRCNASPFAAFLLSATCISLWWSLPCSAQEQALAQDRRPAQDRRLVTNERLILGTETQRSASVRTGDVDGDGDLDLVVASGRHWPQQNWLFLNQSRARFNVARPLGQDLSTSYACELGDLDGDGDLDIVVANDNAPCLVFLNDGTGRFVLDAEVGKPSSVRSLCLSDVDRDEDMDLVFTCRGRANQIYFNDGSAQFTHSATFGSQNDSTIAVAVADLDEDGHNDFILANRDAQLNVILFSTGDWHSINGEPLFRDPLPFGDSDLSSRAVATADFNADGHVDWVMGNIDQSNTVYFGDGHGGVLRTVECGGNDSRTYCVAVADLNNDKHPDIVVGNIGQSNEVYFNRDHGTEFERAAFGESETSTYGLCVGDWNGDGFVDVATANSGQLNRVFINQAVRFK